ncbi:TIGR03086 family metal-binding protein [Nocardioides sp. C4-1]|uniref:TIGR03086 family metal-binding protein n=1 Tax=Nocardioides sp. C4-1 TaxID=3151851 RepID=UPI003267D5F7
MEAHDMTPATQALASLVRSVSDDDLTRPTPCPAYTVGDLVDHIGGLTIAFTAAATKQPLDGAHAGPSGDAGRLEAGWRDRIAADLAGLAEAWADPSSRVGTAQAGPVELPAEVAALVALNEVVVHGWDLAVATGRAWEPDPASVAVCTGFVASFEVPDEVPDGEGPFGAPVEPSADASDLDRLVALAGREPRWSA